MMMMMMRRRRRRMRRMRMRMRMMIMRMMMTIKMRMRAMRTMRMRTMMRMILWLMCFHLTWRLIWFSHINLAITYKYIISNISTYMIDVSLPCLICHKFVPCSFKQKHHLSLLTACWPLTKPSVPSRFTSFQPRNFGHHLWLRRLVQQLATTPCRWTRRDFETENSRRLWKGRGTSIRYRKN